MKLHHDRLVQDQVLPKECGSFDPTPPVPVTGA